MTATTKMAGQGRSFTRFADLPPVDGSPDERATAAAAKQGSDAMARALAKLLAKHPGANVEAKPPRETVFVPPRLDNFRTYREANC